MNDSKSLITRLNLRNSEFNQENRLPITPLMGPSIPRQGLPTFGSFQSLGSHENRKLLVGSNFHADQIAWEIWHVKSLLLFLNENLPYIRARTTKAPNLKWSQIDHHVWTMWTSPPLIFPPCGNPIPHHRIFSLAQPRTTSSRNCGVLVPRNW